MLTNSLRRATSTIGGLHCEKHFSQPGRRVYNLQSFFRQLESSLRGDNR